MPTLNLIGRILRSRSRSIAINPVDVPVRTTRSNLEATTFYQLLLDYFLNNGLYDELAQLFYGRGEWSEALKGIYNPAYRIVGFYVKHLWPGELADALPLSEETPARIRTSVEELWQWNNWQTRKSRDARWAAIFGDRFIKVHDVVGQMRLTLIDPRLVTEFQADERNYLQFIRMDDERLRPNNYTRYVRTEVWDKDAQRMWVWERETWQWDLKEMGRPVETHAFEEFGIDFIPITWDPFYDLGAERGGGSYSLLLDKIDEVNRMATRLHQIQFRFGKPTMAVQAGGNDATGRPLPPPRLGARDGFSNGRTQVGDTDVLYIPGNADVKYLVPNIDYQAALEILRDQLIDLERDACELAYYRLIENQQDLSSRAVRLMLDPAIKSVLEARANLEAGLIRAHQMAFTIGQHAGIFSGLGSFEQGDFTHSFEPREVIPLSEEERGQADQAQGQAATYWLQIGIKPQAIGERLGFKPEEIGEPPELAKPAAQGTPQNVPTPAAPVANGKA